MSDVKRELQGLRHGPGLARPGAVLRLSGPLRARLVNSTDIGAAEGDVVGIVAGLRHAVDKLAPHERRYVDVDFNWAAEHSYPTLTGRQESLARHLGCASKTVRRRADQALETLALLIVAGEEGSHVLTLRAHAESAASEARPHNGQLTSWQERLRTFWKIAGGSRIDIVCSEIPEEERPEFASPQDRNYLRYAKFADLDSLIFARTRLAQLHSDVTVRDFTPSEYFDNDTDVLIVIGGPAWNAKYQQFLAQLPFYFEPHELGEDDPLVVPLLDNLMMGPRWAKGGELVEDLAVFTRLTLTQGITVFLLGGCLTLGVLGAAKCFLDGERGARNAAYITDLVDDCDFVLVTEARRVGGIPDIADLATVNPLLVLAREADGSFATVVDNTSRYVHAVTS